MREIFTGQLDYIYFVYGLVFIIVSVVCFYIHAYRESRLPWFWFGLFGVMLGIYEWLDICALSLGDTGIFKAVRLAILVLSFLSLTEFGRRGLKEITGKKLTPWIHFIAITLASSGSFHGLNGLDITTRYFMGFAGGFFSAVIIYKASDLETGKSRIIFVFLATMLGLYSLSIIFVPPAPLFPASLLNRESFSRVFGFPIQILRSIIIFLLSLALWQYLESLNIPVAQTEKLHRSTQIPRKIVVAVICVIISFGWIFIYLLGKHAGATIIRRARADMSIIVSYLGNEFQKTDHLAQVLSVTPEILHALPNKTPENIAKANSVLDKYRILMGVSVCYLMDSNGTVIASSNRDDLDSFVGKSYRFRSYFQDAISVGFGRFVGIGTTSYERGYYASFPVTGEKNKAVGVIAVKNSLSDTYFTYFPNAFFIDPHGIIFLSSKPGYLFKSLWPIDAKTMAQIIASRQFGDKPVETLLEKEVTNGDLTTFSEEKSYAIRQFVGYGDWSVVLFASARLVSQYRFFGISITIFLCLIVVGFFFVLRHTGNLLAIISSINIRFKEVLGASTQTAIIATGHDGLITIFNPGAETMLGYSESEVVGKRTPEIFHLAAEVEALRKELSTDTGLQVQGIGVFAKAALLGKAKNTEWTLVRKDGSNIIVDLSITAQRNPEGAVTGFLAVAVDITERKQTEEKIRQLAYHDALTGLPNRTLFNDRLEIALAGALRAKKHLAVMMLDLDKFKLINDNFGHPVGDLLLKDVARKLTGLLRKSDTVARMGGDEFMILLSEMERTDDSIAVAWKIVDAFKIPFNLDSHEIKTTTSIGVAIFPENGKNADVLIKNADIALYQAKGTGRNRVVVFSSQWH